jgi:hypothetical protein
VPVLAGSTQRTLSLDLTSGILDLACRGRTSVLRIKGSDDLGSRAGVVSAMEPLAAERKVRLETDLATAGSVAATRTS